MKADTSPNRDISPIMPQADSVPRFPHGRRASKACSYCQSRKVRCSALRSSYPCTNCQLDGVECKFKGKRKASHRNTGHELYMPIPWAIDSLDVPTSDVRLLHQSSKARFTPRGSRLLTGFRSHDAHRPTELAIDLQSSSPPGAAATPIESIHRHQYDHMEHNYIQWNPPHIDPDDFNYLLQKGAFTIPSTDLRNALLKSYIDYVHPHLPMLDLNDFLWRIQSNNGVHCISLLLFQAVMFASASFIDIQYIVQAGYHDRNDARQAFFHRARLLYDFDMETDRTSIVQSLVLMSYWHDFPEEKGCRHWLEVGLSLARRISLHRDPTESSLSSGCSSLRKRLWWSLCVCDEYVCLRTKGQSLISKADFDVPRLSIDDLIWVPFDPS